MSVSLSSAQLGVYRSRANHDHRARRPARASSRGASSERTSFKIANFFAAYAFTAVASPPTGGLSVLLFSSSARNFCCCSEKTRLTTSVSAPPLAPLAAFVFAPPPPAAAAYDRRAHATTRRRNIPTRSRPVLATSQEAKHFIERVDRVSSLESRSVETRHPSVPSECDDEMKATTLDRVESSRVESREASRRVASRGQRGRGRRGRRGR